MTHGLLPHLFLLSAACCACLSLNRHKPVHVAADKPGFLSTEKTFYPEMTTQGAILWGRNNEKSKDFKTDTLTIRLKKADSGAPPLRELPAQW